MEPGVPGPRPIPAIEAEKHDVVRARARLGADPSVGTRSMARQAESGARARRVIERQTASMRARDALSSLIGFVFQPGGHPVTQ